MALDYAAATRIKPPEIEDSGKSYQTALNNRLDEQKIAENELILEDTRAKSEQAREQRMRDAAIKQAIASSATPFDAAQRLDGLDPQAATQYRGQLADQTARLLQGVSSYQAWPSVRPVLEKYIGPQAPESMPAQFGSQAEFDAWKRAQLLAHADLKTYLSETKPSATQDKTREITVTNPDGSTTIKIVKDEPGQEFQSAGKSAAANLGSFEDYVSRTYGANPTSAQLLKARKEWGQADDKATSFAAGDVTKLTPAGIDLAALQFRKTGVMPPLGMGDKSNRQAIINRAASLTPADIARIESGGMDIAGNKADYKADSTSLTKLQQQRDAIGAFEQTAQKNIDQFLKVADKVADTGIPLLNAPVRWLAGAGGSADQAAYDAARQVAVSEIARIVQNPNLTGQLSDSARHEIEVFNPRAATLAQTKAVMKLLTQDMANRAKSLDDQIKDTRGRIGSGKAGATPTTTPSGPGPSYQDYLRSRGK